MQTKTTFKFLSATLMSLILTACGGGGSSALDNATGGGSGSAPNIRIGSGSGTSFKLGAISVKAGDSDLILNGEAATLSISIVDETGTAVTNSYSVSFKSSCIDSGRSKISEGAVVYSLNGTVTAEYKALSCKGKDEVTATATYSGKILAATGTVNVSGIRLGTGASGDFIPTKLDLGSNYTSLFADQTTTISVNAVNDAGATVKVAVPITFSSGCIDARTSSITGGNTTNTIDGTAKVEYKAGSCFGDDTIVARATYANETISASATISQINNKRIGSGTGASFTPSELILSTANTLFEGDTVQITANIVNNQSTLISQATQVAFDSPCLSAGLATMAGGNIVNSINGVARAQYKVGKCDIDDQVTGTIANGNGTVTATVSLPIDTRRLGSGFGSSFINNALELGIGSGSLSPGGSTTITAYVVNSKGDLVTDPMDVTFTSPCLSAGNAVITGGNTVKTVNGKAVANYTSQGCGGVAGIDALKASATFRTLVLNASADLAVKSDTAQTISFVDATPTLISIKGTGGKETSILRFRVLGQGGSPLKGICVNFAPSTTLGGLALVPSKCNPAGPETYGSSTDADGYATTTVQAGTVATAVRVTATTANGLSTQSSALAISTGIPDQNSTSLSLSDLAPIAWEHDGIESKATIRLADAFNNPAPDGTTVAFTTNGGSIDANCTTVKGACTVTWRSQSPRPKSTNSVSFATTSPFGKICPAILDLTGNIVNECRSGRVTILATAIGNESFIDGNGNGLYDDVAIDTFAKHSPSDNTDPNRNACNPSAPQSSASIGATKGCDDLPEAYVDGNFNNFRTTDEESVDFNENATHDAANGKYDGALCSGAAKTNGKCTTNKVTVRDSSTLVMSCETPFFQSGLLPGQHATESFTVGQAGALRSVPMLLADCNGNGMPAGTTVKVTTTNLVNATATISPSTALRMSIEPSIITLFITPDKDPAKIPSGAVIIEITSAGTTTTTTVNVAGI